MGTSGTSGSVGNTARTDGTQRVFTETLLKSVIKSVWNAGGNPTMIMVGPFNKQKLSGFTGNSTRFDAGADATLYTSVDVYASDFGQLQVVPKPPDVPEVPITSFVATHDLKPPATLAAVAEPVTSALLEVREASKSLFSSFAFLAI